MPITHIEGDLFATHMPAIAHGCNTQGEMSTGVAKAMRNKYPEIFEPYVIACKQQAFTVGLAQPIKTRKGVTVFNLATQDQLGPNARLEWIDSSVRAALNIMGRRGIAGVAIPRIGSGIGGLEWEDVLATLKEVAGNYPHITMEIRSL